MQMKKLLIFATLFLSLQLRAFWAYDLTNEDKVFINKVSQKITTTIDKAPRSKYRTSNIVIQKLERYKKNLKNGTRKEVMISHIVHNIKDKYYRNSDIRTVKIDNWFSSQKITNLVDQNQKDIASFDNIFIFRYKNDLSRSQVKILTDEIKKLNPKARIFTDQEGWLINRFKEFEGEYTLWKMMKDNFYVNKYYNELSADIKWKLHKKISWRPYFMSMEEIWDLYEWLPVWEQDSFLKFMAYYRLESLRNAWLNTAPLVVDLDYWNPVISWYNRSFGKDKNSYIEFWKHFVDAAHRLEMSIYLKHFPGHWKGSIDTHTWVLTYTKGDLPYIKKNMEVFDEIIKYANSKNVEIWAMVWHFVLPDEYKYKFYSILSKVDFIITDDLAMKWYIEWKKQKLSENQFFSTSELDRFKNVIKLDSWIAQIK